MDLVEVSRRLSAAVSGLSFAPPVACVYNPLAYAAVPHETYLRRYGRGPKEVVFVGMNPGPWGMAQTGVPFGEIEMVRDWLGVTGPIGKPTFEHPKRPITGFRCHRSEVSGRRLWGWVRERFQTPERFFERFFVWNYCPLTFMEDSGRNRTPDKLPAAEREPLFAACDQALREMVAALEPRVVVGIGVFAEARARRSLPGVTIGRILHPSPASPRANTGWGACVEGELEALGVAVG